MGLLERISEQKNEEISALQKEKGDILDVYSDIKERLHNSVIEELSKENTTAIETQKVRQLIEQTLEKDGESVPRADRAKLISDVINDIMGYGPLEELLADPAVTEIMVNGPKMVYIERSGKLELSNLKFRNDAHVLNVIDRIVSTIGRHIDESSPMVDARLVDGSRVNAIIPPISLSGPVITIRKFSKNPYTVQNLIDFGSFTPKIASFLQACVRGKLNIIVSGGTGSGKTTLLNVLSSFIPDNERIVTIEDAAELQLNQRHVITLECRPSNLEGKGQVSIRDLVKNSLRMRPDRIIVGEVRSGETLDMLQAMNTGHDGSLTTAHANSPRDTISRIETMVMMAGMELPLKAIRDQVVSAVDLIVQQSRLRDGSRKVTHITEVVGMEGDVVVLQDIFRFETEGVMDSAGKFKGYFKPTGIRPYFLEKIREKGVSVNDDWFN